MFDERSCLLWLFGTCVLLVAMTETIFGQIKYPEEPKFETMQERTSQYIPDQNYQIILPQYPSQQRIIDPKVERTNREAMIKMGHTPPPNHNPTHEEIVAQANAEAYYFSQQEKRRREVIELLHEIKEDENKLKYSDKYSSPEFISQTKSYQDALSGFKDMLNGNQPLSFKKTYWLLELAYGNTYLSYKEYDKIIQESASFIKTWLTQNGYNTKDNEIMNMGIQAFMRDTLTITKQGDNIPKKTTHLPFAYDYVDFTSENDHRNFFITKCLATGFGQCNSLPGVYLVLAEAMGAEASLAFAPQHSFIKYPDNEGKLHSYEPTSNWHISDQWYVDNFHISQQARKSGIYLRSLSKKEVIGSCLNDLAFGYLVKYGAADGKFVADCINTSLNAVPDKSNIFTHFVFGSLRARQLNRIMNTKGYKTVEQIQKDPQTSKIYQELIQNEEIIEFLGFQEMPEEMYSEIMQQSEFKGKLQQNKSITGKEKRSLFISIN